MPLFATPSPSRFRPHTRAADEATCALNSRHSTSASTVYSGSSHNKDDMLSAKVFHSSLSAMAPLYSIGSPGPARLCSPGRLFWMQVADQQVVIGRQFCTCRYTRREYKLKLMPWITQGIISSIKHRDYLFHIYKRSKLLTDFETYKQFRNRVTHVKDLAKRKYYEEQFAQNRRNSKRTSKLINDIFGKPNHLVFLKD